MQAGTKNLLKLELKELGDLEVHEADGIRVMRLEDAGDTCRPGASLDARKLIGDPFSTMIVRGSLSYGSIVGGSAVPPIGPAGIAVAV